MADGTNTPREHVEDIVHHAHKYQIHVAGTMDGASTRDPVGYANYQQTWENNISVCLENVGTETVHNPWVVINGKRPWRSMGEILEGLITPGMSDRDKARVIWEFGRRHRYHSTTGDDEVKDTVKMLNVYGYTLCWDEAYTMANLWQAAGLPIRRGMPHGHCTTEVFYDEQFHLLDSDEHLLYLLRDNRTIASEQDLARDHDLVKRGHAYGILSQDDPQRDEQAASLFVHAGPRAGGRPMLTRHRMELDLRPGEALIWEWTDRAKYHGRGKRPPRLANGRLRFAPRLDEDFARWADQHVNLVADGSGLAPQDPANEAILIYRIRTPYVCVGGRVDVHGWEVEISFDGESWARVELSDLDPHFPHDGPARYEYHLRLRSTGVRLDSLEIQTDVQMAPLSLPALEAGDNEVRYTDATEGRRHVRVSHVWTEREDVRPLQPPSRPRHPEPGGRLDCSQATFVWDPVAGAADYEFRLSEYQDMRWALSPVFEKLISRTPSAGRAQWWLPKPGLLNPGQSYYWQIRCRTKEGLWGPWSPVWRFTAEGPGFPVHVALIPDWGKRTIRLQWQPNTQGTPPSHYEVYGSNERGFSPHREPYTMFAGKDTGEITAPSNLLATTPDTKLTVVGPDIPDSRGNRVYYRVVAVDSHGRRSGPSDYVEAPRPFVYTLPPLRAVAGQECQYAIRALASKGDLRSVSDGPHRYQSAFRDGDTLRFLLDEGPDFLALNDQTGILTARPEPRHLGFHTVTLHVVNSHGGTDAQGFDLQVVG